MNQHLTSAQLISHHRSRPDYQSSAPQTIQFAYGDHRYTKFTYQLLNQALPLQQKILKQVQEDFCLCENIDLCLKSSDLMSVLFKHLSHQNVTIRTLATKSIAKICASQFGRLQIIKTRGTIQKFEIMIDDQVSQIRQAAIKGLINFADTLDGIDQLLSGEKILKHLVDKLVQEKNVPILTYVVALIKMLMQGEDGIPKILGTQGNGRLMNLIQHQQKQIRYNVCMSLANISFNQYGKQKIVEKGYIKTIIQRLKDDDKLVRQSACLLLCSLAQLNQGKIQILDQCDFKTIINLLDDTPPIVLNAVQLIANLAENPKGQQLSYEYLQKIDKITCIQRKYIDQTLSVIKWKP